MVWKAVFYSTWLSMLLCIQRGFQLRRPNGHKTMFNSNILLLKP